MWLTDAFADWTAVVGNDLQTPIEGVSFLRCLLGFLLTVCVSESGNMLIMALSYTQKSGDDSLVKTYVRADDLSV